MPQFFVGQFQNSCIRLLRVAQAFPYSGVIFDGHGNLYGATTQGGAHNGGTVFQLTPSTGGWNFNLIYTFTGNGGGPVNSLIMDAAGNLYGATSADGAHGFGFRDWL